MKKIRIGTRGSDLALWQTNWVSQQLQSHFPALIIEQVIIKTHGDMATHQPLDEHWPVGGFVGTIENALRNGKIDLAVHSHKDLQTAPTPGLIVAAIPKREVAHDTLITKAKVDLRNLPKGYLIGTSSPRRAAQFRRLADVEVIPLRGNVPTRVAKLEQGQLDGVVLAAAGLKRLSIEPKYRIDLPTDVFVPAPAQGALALQTRDQGETMKIVSVLDDAATRKIVTTERAFLRYVGAGCHTPVGALAYLDGHEIVLLGQLFSEDGLRVAQETQQGKQPDALGKSLADNLLRQLG